MSVRYLILSAFFDLTRAVEIDRTDFEELDTAVNYLLEVVALEERFGLIDANYAEFRADLVETASFWSHGVSAYQRVQKKRVLLNRRFANVLTATKLYLDAGSKTEFDNLLPLDQRTAEWFRKQTNDKHAALFGYQWTDALRNYVQHRATPIHTVNVVSGSPDLVTVHGNIERYARDKIIKRDLLDALRKVGPTVELSEPLNCYVGALREIHTAVREVIQPIVIKHQQVVMVAINRYETAFPSEDESVRGCYVVEMNGKLEMRRFMIFDDLLEYLDHLTSQSAGASELA